MEKMKKAVIALVSAAVVALMLALVLLGGCGQPKTETYSGKARQILSDTNKKMQAVKSLKVSGAYDVQTKMQGSENANFDYSMEVNAADPQNTERHVSVKGKDKSSEVYVVGGYAYSDAPGQGWVKVKAGESDSLSQSTPAGMLELAASAKNLRMVSEDANTYGITFNVGGDYLEQQIRQALGVDQSGLDLEGELDTIVKNTSMRADFTISKSTMYIDSAKLTMKMRGIPVAGDMGLVMTMAFSGFNEPVAISLPEEARSAREVVETPTTPPGSVPVFPGTTK